MDIQVFKEKLFDRAFAYGFSDCEIYFENGSSFEVQIFRGEISQYKNSVTMGLSFRGTYQGRVGYAYTEKIDEDVMDWLVKSAAHNSDVIEAAEIEKLYAGDSSYPQIDVEPFVDISVEKKIELAKAMEKAVYDKDSRVKSVDYCLLGNGAGETYIANSLGLEVRHGNQYCIAYVYARVEENEQTKVAGEIWFDRGWDSFSVDTIADKAVKKAISYLGSQSVPSKKYGVIFDNITACEMLNTFKNIFYAENVQKGFSLLKGKLDTKIARDIVTIRDDGVYQKSLGNVPFDSEGVATRNKAVIESGVLKTFLYNLKTAEKDGVVSTGNGFKPSFRSPVDTACTNFYLQPGSVSQEELLRTMGNGLMITELAGLHSGTNAVSGDFSLSADGYLIENGKIVRPVEQITLAGNFYSLLHDIIGVANDLRFDLPSGSGTIGSPSVYVRELTVSGV